MKKIMRSEKADERLQRVRDKKCPYYVVLNDIEIRVDTDVYPSGELSSWVGDYLEHGDFGIKKGDLVLDYGTGTGHLAIVAALCGAEKVIAIDINPAAINCAKANIQKYHLENKVEFRQGNCFEMIRSNEKFDYVIAGMPWEEADATDMLERSCYDPRYTMRKALFDHALDVLLPGGKILTTWSVRMQKQINLSEFDNRYTYEVVAEKMMHDDLHFIYMIKPKN